MADQSHSSPADRRRFRRYPAAELKAFLRVKKGLFGEQWIQVEPLDFSLRGLAIDAALELVVEENVTLALELVMDMGTIRVEKLAGIVRYSAPRGSQCRYGIEFDFEGPRFMRSPEIEGQLARIEALLERSHQVSDRIQSQQRERGQA